MVTYGYGVKKFFLIRNKNIENRTIIKFKPVL